MLYGENDFGKSICLAVGMGFDTDCNDAAVGSVMSMKNGIYSIGKEWTASINNKLKTTLIGVEITKISDPVKKTMEHIDKK